MISAYSVLLQQVYIQYNIHIMDCCNPLPPNMIHCCT